ncbi:hypothetical protein Bache_0664 [Bacteroides helcogenes P 36-108]|uniref:Uncharacterized protein n=1 Tax=Bacteroides helcogenes (strain ATCC 35417 / DSM 20613 / JCM 6297 / CCUG 15421 / P 36-108) TaxID=693979 RepID=E6SMX1_BACT6|nr:hypothetical protein Bache_0664 [Bacteroides helcogenes P 36-108]
MHLIDIKSYMELKYIKMSYYGVRECFHFGKIDEQKNIRQRTCRIFW